MEAWARGRPAHTGDGRLLAFNEANEAAAIADAGLYAVLGKLAR